MSPLRGSGDKWGLLVSPRLHRGLQDHARYAGFSMGTPVSSRRYGTCSTPQETGDPPYEVRHYWNQRECSAC